MSMDEQWAREHVGTMPSVGGCGTSYHDERGEVQDCTSVEPCRACLRRRVARLEAQVEKFPAMVRDAERSGEYLGSAKAQRGRAVVVPEFIWDEAHGKAKNYFESWDELSPVIYANGGAEWYALAVSRIQSIPADRVLADGIVGVDREEWEVTSALALRLANWYNGHEINRTIWPPELQRYRAIDALRAQQAKGE